MTAVAPIVFTNFIGSNLKAAGIIALLGRNILSNFVMVYNGPGGFVSLSFSSGTGPDDLLDGFLFQSTYKR